MGLGTRGPQQAHLSLTSPRLRLEQAPIRIGQQLHLGRLGPQARLTTRSG
jgi:hypothetical protein